MIATLKGTILEKTFNSIIIEVNHIGYRVWMNTEKLHLNQEIRIYTHLQIKEDAHILYGFLNQSDLHLFEKLISVKGIGCKTAIGFFTVYDAYTITNAIENNDIGLLKKLPQVGNKAAQQIILDLKGKISLEDHQQSGPLQEALEALSALGYGSAELKKLEKQLSTVQLESSDAYVKQALQFIAKGGK